MVGPVSLGRFDQPTILGAFLAGSLVIIAIRWAAPGLGGAILATFLAVAIIVWHGYGRRKESDRGRTADDTYYLGLLFTLVSLVFALVYLFIVNPEGDLDERTQALIGNFGIGLLSTVAGILGRILLQGPPSGNVSTATGQNEQIVPQSGDELAQDTMALRRQVRDATDAMRHFTRTTLAEANQTRSHTKLAIGEFSNELRSTAQQALSHSASEWKALNAELMPIRNALNESSQAFTALTENMRGRVEQAQEFAINVIEELRQEIDAAAERSRSEATSAWREAAQQLRNHAVHLLTELEKGGEATSQHVAASIANLSTRLADSSETTLQTLNSQVQAMTALVEHTRQANQSFERLATGILAVEVSLKSFDGAAGSTVKTIDARAQEVTKLRDDVAGIAESSLKRAVKVEETAGELSNKVSAQVGRLQRLVERLEPLVIRLGSASPRLPNNDRENV